MHVYFVRCVPAFFRRKYSSKDAPYRPSSLLYHFLPKICSIRRNEYCYSAGYFMSNVETYWVLYVQRLAYLSCFVATHDVFQLN